MTTQSAQVEATTTAPVVAAKPAKKAATATKAPALAKSATAPAKKASAKPAPKAKAKAKAAPLAFALIDRPVSGGRLFAYTQAVLALTGLEKGAAVPKATLRKVMGDTAIRFHLDKGTMAQDGANITLTAGGMHSFGERLAKIDQSLVEAFTLVMTKGEPVEAVCKNAANIRAIG